MRLETPPWMQWPQTRALLKAFADAGKPMRFVGGCVRDSLLLRPVQDVDIATPALPDEVMSLLGKAGIRAILTGLGHGTVTALVEGKHFEITTLRRDMACDGRHAEVEYTEDWKTDAARRDFTINALYADAGGEIYDYFGGLSHLKPVQVLFIGDPVARIEEDALRILRFFRFMAQLGVPAPDAAALEACSRKASMLSGLSGERIAQEMLKLLAAPALDMSLLSHMQQAGVLQALHLVAPPAALAHFAEPDALGRLALWLMQGGEAERQAAVLRNQWKLSGVQYRTLLELLRAASALQDARATRAQKKILREAGKDIFCRAARIAMAIRPEEEHTYAGALQLASAWSPPVFPLTGQDLLDHGYSEGRALGDQLKMLETQWEEEDYHPTRGELLKRLPERRDS